MQNIENIPISRPDSRLAEKIRQLERDSYIQQKIAAFRANGHTDEQIGKWLAFQVVLRSA